jgi:uncharacterized membrane protein (DUF2068 family)
MTGAQARKRGKKPKPGGSGPGRGHLTGTRAVALFEATKGAIVVLAGLGLLALIHHDAQDVAEDIVHHLHLNPARHFPRIFIDAAATATDTRLWALALTAMFYAAVRFAESYGLWHKRAWAEWFAILTGGIYLPVELYELTVSVTPVKTAVFLVNLFIVAWLSRVRWEARGTSS